MAHGGSMSRKPGLKKATGRAKQAGRVGGGTGRAPGDGVPGGGVPATLVPGQGVKQKPNAVTRAYADTPIKRRP